MTANVWARAISACITPTECRSETRRIQRDLEQGGDVVATVVALAAFILGKLMLRYLSTDAAVKSSMCEQGLPCKEVSPYG